MRGTGIRPPSRIPANVGLSELTISDNNARAMMPPPKLRHKTPTCKTRRAHKTEAPSDTQRVPEAVPKRKTLVERAGEAPRTLPTASNTSRPAKLALNTNSLASIKPVSLASSNNPSRGPSTASRNTSNSSVSTSSSNTRPTSAASNYRPQSVLSNSRSISNGLSQHKRSAPYYDDDEEEESQNTMQPSKRKGMPLYTLSAIRMQDRLRPLKQRERPAIPERFRSFPSRAPSSRSQSPFSPSHAERSSRNISLSTAFEGLSLQQRCDEPPRESTFPCSYPIPQCSNTPSQIPKLLPKTPRAVQAQPCKTPLTKYKIRHASPMKLEYLTRDSNTPAPAWDTKGRLEDMEMLYSQLKDQFQGAAFEKNGLEESLALYKTRRMYADSNPRLGH